MRNLVPFSGGNNAYSVTVQLPKDRQTAINIARTFVALQKAQVPATLASPCKENLLGASNKMVVSWGCQFAVYKVPSYMRVLGAKLAGKDFLVDVAFIPRPHRIWVK